jgi:hypothetical protein
MQYKEKEKKPKAKETTEKTPEKTLSKEEAAAEMPAKESKVWECFSCSFYPPLRFILWNRLLENKYLQSMQDRTVCLHRGILPHHLSD